MEVQAMGCVCKCCGSFLTSARMVPAPILILLGSPQRKRQMARKGFPNTATYAKAKDTLCEMKTRKHFCSVMVSKHTPIQQMGSTAAAAAVCEGYHEEASGEKHAVK